jgi:N-acylglucosamine 2-epimerase
LKAVLETVAPRGRPMLDLPEGRLINPGHALEAAWFLLHHNRRQRNEHVQKAALRMVMWSLEHGWDDRHGGIFYYQDIMGKPPVQLEWNMKLWWVQAEAIYATLRAYAASGEKRFLTWFERVTEWTFAHFPDHKYGEWFGYLDRAGHVSQRLKGGPYKGCFHIPRCLLYSATLISQILHHPQANGGPCH